METKNATDRSRVFGFITIFGILNIVLMLISIWFQHKNLMNQIRLRDVQERQGESFRKICWCPLSRPDSYFSVTFDSRLRMCSFCPDVTPVEKTPEGG